MRPERVVFVSIVDGCVTGNGSGAEQMTVVVGGSDCGVA